MQRRGVHTRLGTARPASPAAMGESGSPAELRRPPAPKEDADGSSAPLPARGAADDMALTWRACSSMCIGKSSGASAPDGSASAYSKGDLPARAAAGSL